MAAEPIIPTPPINTSYFDQIDPNWQSRVKKSLAMGFTFQTLRVNFQAGLMGGVAFATAEVVSILADPIFKKLGTHGHYALQLLPQSLIIATVLFNNPGMSISMVAIRFFLSVGCEKAGIPDHYKMSVDGCLSIGMNIAVITGSSILGIQSLPFLAVIAIIQELSFPWFKEKVKEAHAEGHRQLTRKKLFWENTILNLKTRISKAFLPSLQFTHQIIDILDRIQEQHIQLDFDLKPLKEKFMEVTTENNVSATTQIKYVQEQLNKISTIRSSLENLTDKETLSKLDSKITLLQTIQENLRSIQTELNEIEKNKPQIEKLAEAILYTDQNARSDLEQIIFPWKAVVLINHVSTASPLFCFGLCVLFPSLSLFSHIGSKTFTMPDHRSAWALLNMRSLTNKIQFDKLRNFISNIEK